MADSSQRGGIGLYLWLLVVFITCAQALPAPEYEYRDLHPVYDMGLSKEFVREIEQKYGDGSERWVAQPRDAKEDKLWTFQKRLAWNGPCGNATDGAFFISNNYNRVFQFRCSWTGFPVGLGTMQSGLVVYTPNLMDCVDRCASNTYWNLNTNAKCRNVELRNNGECRMYNSFSATTTISYNAAASMTAWATWVTQADCNALDTVAISPIFTPCGTFLAGTVQSPSTYLVGSQTSTYTFSEYSNWATRTPTATTSQVSVCSTSFAFNSACVAS